MCYIDSKGELNNFKFFSLDEFTSHINEYNNCFTLRKCDLEEHEMNSIVKDYGEVVDVLLVCVDYPKSGAYTYYLIEKENKFQICLLNDIVDIESPNEFSDKLSYLTEYKI